MTDAFDVDADEYEGINLTEIASEETFALAVEVGNTWRDNIRQGEGVRSRDHPWVNSGEAANDVAVDPPAEGALEYEVGGDVVQLAVAEYGRSPGSFPPPEPIADWIREQLGEDDPDPFPIQRSIAKRGIKGFAPARAAANEYRGELAARIGRRINDLLDELEV